MLLALVLVDLNRKGSFEIIGNKSSALYLLKHFPESFYSIATCGNDYCTLQRILKQVTEI